LGRTLTGGRAIPRPRIDNAIQEIVKKLPKK
jgi:hypothetical protein